MIPKRYICNVIIYCYAYYKILNKRNIQALTMKRKICQAIEMRINSINVQCTLMAPFWNIEVFLWFTHRRHPIVSLVLWVAFPCVCHSLRGHIPPHCISSTHPQHSTPLMGLEDHCTPHTHSVTHTPHSTLVYTARPLPSTPFILLLFTLLTPPPPHSPVCAHHTHTTTSFYCGAPRGQVLGEGMAIAETHMYTHTHIKKKKTKRRKGKGKGEKIKYMIE